jgi:sporulation protein YlmC with PRC-barrel domain
MGRPPAGRAGGRTTGDAVFEADDIRDWRGEDVVDSDGAKIGSLESVYFDTASQQAVFAAVKVGIVGRHRLAFVPLDGARVSPRSVRVMADKKLVKDAPSIDTDGELTAEEEPGIFAHYGLPYSAGAGGERRLGRR